jgi:glycosyltransferase involved in cell wall biosynthesis
MIKPDFEHHDSKLVVAHYPHKSYVKGTEMIFDTLAVLEDSKVFCHNTRGWKYYINDGLVSWEENLKRIAGCDIYIEAVKPELRGKPYGEWGITALEAAALGRIVVTHFRSYDRYVKEYGPCPLQVANNAEEFRAVMMKLLAMSWPEIDALKRETRMWVEKFHSLKAVGQRLKEKVYESLFT